MQAFFEKISKKFQRQCSRMELFPFGGEGFFGQRDGEEGGDFVRCAGGRGRKSRDKRRKYVALINEIYPSIYVR